MIVHALVEGSSEKAFLEPWARRFLKYHLDRGTLMLERIVGALDTKPMFRLLCAGLKELVAPGEVTAEKRKKPRRAKTAVEKDASGKRGWNR